MVIFEIITLAYVGYGLVRWDNNEALFVGPVLAIALTLPHIPIGKATYALAVLLVLTGTIPATIRVATMGKGIYGFLKNIVIDWGLVLISIIATTWHIVWMGSYFNKIEPPSVAIIALMWVVGWAIAQRADNNKMQAPRRAGVLLMGILFMLSTITLWSIKEYGLPASTSTFCTFGAITVGGLVAALAESDEKINTLDIALGLITILIVAGRYYL